MNAILRFLWIACRISRPLAINHRESGFLTAANAQAMPALEGDAQIEEWLMISPYGEFPNQKGLQRMTRGRADLMVIAFNSLVGRAKRGFRGLPIYIGHPDVMPQRWTDDRRYGKVTKLEAREDGLYGLVAWNDLGLKNREQGYYVYPSPAWYFPKRADGVVEPDELLSIGLTNTPQIAESAPWTKNTADPGDNSAEKIMKEKLIKLLGLAADATDEQIETAVNAKITEIGTLVAQAQTAKAEKATVDTALNTAKARVTELEGKVRDVVGAHAKDLLDAAINTGRITQADRPTHEAAFNSDFATAAKALSDKQPALNTKEIVLGDRKASIATAQERSAIINSAVADYQREHKCDYETAYNAIEHDPRFAAVFAAMQKPKAA